MSKIVKCDICGKMFDGGFLIEVNRQGGYDFTDDAQDRFEIGAKDICRDCYYSVKKYLHAVVLRKENKNE